MAELLTRISLRYDDLAAWTNESVEGQGAKLKLNKGEVGICAIPSGVSVNGVQNPPHIMFKVGDGVKTFGELPWTSANAADVYAWAKQSESDFTTWVKGLIDIGDIDLSEYYKKSEITTLLSDNSTADQKYAKDYADGLIAVCNVTDTAVEGEYVSAVSQANGKITVSREKLPTYTLTTGVTNGTVKFNGEEVEVAGLGSAAYTASTAYATAEQGGKADTAVQSVNAGSANGTISVDGSDVSVTGLKSAAYTEASAYATAAQGSKADSAVQSVTVLGETLSNGGELTVAEAKTALGLKSAAYAETTAFDAAGSAATAKSEAISEAASDAASKYATIKAAQDAQAAADSANEKIDAFMSDDAAIEGAIDTLKEINQYISEDTDAFTALSERVGKLEDGTTPAKEAEHADVASGLDATGVAQVEGIKVNNATNADVAAKASGLDASGEAAVKAVKVDNATEADNATKLGGKAASEYVTKTEAPGYDDILTQTTAEANYVKKTDAAGYDDILTKTAAATTYQPKGEYASAAQGAKADSAVQSVAIATGTENGKVKLTVDGAATEASVYGLKSAAYTESSAYATSAQGAKADSAVQSVTGTNGIVASVDDSHNVTVTLSNTEIFVINCGTATTVI